MAERFVRALYREHAEGNARIAELIGRIGELDRHPETRLVFEEAGGAWKAGKAA